MKRKIITLIIVFLLIILINQIAIIISEYYHPKVDLSWLFNKENKADKKPPLAPEWSNWELLEKYDPQSIGNSNISNLIIIRNGTKEANLKFSGNEWLSEEKFENIQGLDNAKDMTNYYMNSLVKDGWTFSVNLDDKTISGVAVSNRHGNALSYVKLLSRELQLFVLVNETRSPCPCKIIHRVFLSDPIKVEDVLKN